MQASFFQIKNLSVKVGGFSIDNVNLAMERHSYLVLLGKVASGKTVLLKTICGFFEKHEGDIILDGKLINALHPKDRQIGYVPQHNDLFPNMNVRDNIAFPLKIRGKMDIDKKVRELLELMEIAKIADRRIQNLSGGERKKTAIARAIASEPKLLLLDEPLGMLDAPARKSVLDRLRNIHESSGISVIHVSHERRDAWDVGKLCALMEDGKIVHSGSPEELFRRPKTVETALFLGCENVLSAKFAKTETGMLAIVNKGLNFELKNRFCSSSGFIVIRPEFIEFNVSKAEVSKAENGFKAKIISVADKGEFCEFRISCCDKELTAYCGHSESQELKPGKEHKFYVKTENIHVIA